MLNYIRLRYNNSFTVLQFMNNEGPFTYWHADMTNVTEISREWWWGGLRGWLGGIGTPPGTTARACFQVAARTRRKIPVFGRRRRRQCRTQLIRLNGLQCISQDNNIIIQCFSSVQPLIKVTTTIIITAVIYDGHPRSNILITSP